jgi:signal peptidase I
MKKEFKVKRAKKKREQSFYRELFELLAETAVFVFFVMTFVFQAFQIPTGSMEPTLLVGDFLLVNKMIYYNPASPVEKLIMPRKDIKRHDIVVFKFPGDLKKDFVKRVIGLQGEKLEVKDKQVFINDVPISENYKVHIDSQARAGEDYYYYNNSIKDNYGPVFVPAGYCFVMGDNRDNSQDSRTWGFLDLNLIKGKPWVVYFSYDAEKDAYKKTGLRERLKKFVYFIIKARWKRLFKIVR